MGSGRRFLIAIREYVEMEIQSESESESGMKEEGKLHIVLQTMRSMTKPCHNINSNMMRNAWKNMTINIAQNTCQKIVS